MDNAGENARDSNRGLAPGGPGSGPASGSGPQSGSRQALPTGARPRNGVKASLLTGAVWRKSSLSGPNGNCVEAAELPAGIALRNSRFPEGPALLFTTAEWDAFLSGVKGGEFG